MLNSLGFSVSYTEARRYEYSVMESSEDEHGDPERYIQFIFDNADHNIQTPDGHNTFHSLGGVKCITPAPLLPACSMPRLTNLPVANEIAAKGRFEIKWYKKPNRSGLKDICIKKLKNDVLLMKPYVLIDNLWMCGYWAGLVKAPSWNGFMRSAFDAEMTCERSSVDALPFINLEPGNLSTLYTALLFAAKQCRLQGQSSCLVTFDQPLYIKAVGIVSSDTSGDLSIVTVRLGGFHLLMSFLGSIGYIMSGSGLEELWAQVYAKTSVVHMLSGHSYSRALRAHFLVQHALGTILLARLDVNIPLKDTLKQLHLDVLNGLIKPTDAIASECITTIENSLQTLIGSLSSENRTAKLWLSYYNQVGLIRHFIRSERTGNWNLHINCIKEMLPFMHAAGHMNYAKSAYLYVQQMEDLETSMPELYNKLNNKGYFTIRRNHKFWSGNWTDMVIEQDLMRPMKMQGGVTRGRGMTDSVLAQWILSGPGCLSLCNSMVKVTGITTGTSEQHIELRDSSRTKDQQVLEKFISWLDHHSPFESHEYLRSLSTGIVGYETINCDSAKEKGLAAMEQMLGDNYGDVKLKRTNRVIPLSHVNGSLKINNIEQPVNSHQLIMRIIAVMQRNTDLERYLCYELAPKPPSLFDEISMRKTKKSVLADIFFSSSQQNTCLQAGQSLVIDGGWLLNTVQWPQRPRTYDQICDTYINYMETHYGTSYIIIFDGYENQFTTKQEEQKRRALGKYSADIVFNKFDMAIASQYDFLSNTMNKVRLIQMLCSKLKSVVPGVKSLRSNADADEKIVQCALDENAVGHQVTVVATDTDILIMLIGRAPRNNNITVLHPPTNKTPGKEFSIKGIQITIGDDMIDSIIFLHAITGCDTTSAIFNKGKKTAWNIFSSVGRDVLKRAAATFNSKNADKENIAKAGEEFIIYLYKGKIQNCDSLNDLRVRKYRLTVARQSLSASFDLSTLPPTGAACRQHAFRTYLQVQEWYGEELPPLEWGWKEERGSLKPIPTELPAAPEELLRLMFCNCKKTCNQKCECRRAGLTCSAFCGHCGESRCSNAPTFDEEQIEG